MLIAVAMIGGIATSFNQVTELDATFNSQTENKTPFNISLDQIPVAVTNVTNGSITIPADNYTIFASAKKLQIDSNETFTGKTITAYYTYEPEAYISGTGKTVLGLAIAILIIGIIYMVLSIKRR